MNYAELVRTANQYGLLRVAWDTWTTFREARNNTAHAYSEPMADEIAKLVPSFYEEVRYMYGRMVEKEDTR